MFYFRANFWVPVAILLPPSLLLHIMLLVTIAKWQRKGLYNSLFYRIFVVQSLLELLLLFQYLAGRLLIKDRLLSNDTIIWLNGAFFPRYYYHGTVYYFFHVQIWGVIEQSFIRFLHICAPYSCVTQKLKEAGYLPVIFVNIMVPAALSAREFFQETIVFLLDEEGNAALFTPPQVVESNATQSKFVSATATAFCAVCYILVIGKLVLHKKQMKEVSNASYRDEWKLTAVGLALFLTQCTMTAYYAIVMYTAQSNPEIVAIARNVYIYPVLAMVFVNPWMLTFMHKGLRRQ